MALEILSIFLSFYEKHIYILVSNWSVMKFQNATFKNKKKKIHVPQNNKATLNDSFPCRRIHCLAFNPIIWIASGGIITAISYTSSPFMSPVLSVNVSIIHFILDYCESTHIPAWNCSWLPDHIIGCSNCAFKFYFIFLFCFQIITLLMYLSFFLLLCFVFIVFWSKFLSKLTLYIKKKQAIVVLVPF